MSSVTDTVMFTSVPSATGVTGTDTSKGPTTPGRLMAWAIASRNCAAIAPNESGVHPTRMTENVTTTVHTPCGHSVHAAAPSWEYHPAGQGRAVPLVDPAGHWNRWGHTAVQAALVAPGSEPKRPAGHRPVHRAEAWAGASP